MAKCYDYSKIESMINRTVFFGANILLYIFWPTGSFSREKEYSSIFKKLLAQKNAMAVDFIVISEEINSEKPSEKNYTLVEEHFQAQTYWYIADNVKKDFIVPNQRNNWHGIAILDNGLNIHKTFNDYSGAKYLPDHLIESFEDIVIV